MVTLGGLGSISGAILAAVVLTLLPEVLRPIARLSHGDLFAVAGGHDASASAGLAGRMGALADAPRPCAAASADGRGAGARMSDAADALLRAEHLSRTFGGLTAVSDFCLRIAPGELQGLIGPNGAGKTTCFNLITGVYPPSSGQIWLGAHRIDGRPPAAINRRASRARSRTSDCLPACLFSTTSPWHLIVRPRRDWPGRFCGRRDLPEDDRKSKPRRWSYWPPWAFRTRPVWSPKTCPMAANAGSKSPGAGHAAQDSPAG